jgi:hypothetical protein
MSGDSPKIGTQSGLAHEGFGFAVCQLASALSKEAAHYATIARKLNCDFTLIFDQFGLAMVIKDTKELVIV